MIRGFCLILLLLLGAPAWAVKYSAEFAEPTTRYPHRVLGDIPEWGSMVIKRGNRKKIFVLPYSRVFEDIAPRVIDLDADGEAEIIVVESHQDFGSRLAIYDWDGLVTTTPYVGERFRWIAPLGAVDLDGDGFMEIGFVDRPHLVQIFTIYSFIDKNLVFLGEMSGLTNHRIGEEFISGGVRDCKTARFLLVTSDWDKIASVRSLSGRLRVDYLGPYNAARMKRLINSCQTK